MTAPILAFTGHRDTLLPLVENVSKIVRKNENFVILENLLIQGAPTEGLSITSTDLGVTAVATSENVDIAVTGSICVNAELFRTSLSKMPEAPITVEVGADGLTMKSGRARQKCLTLPAGDFPDVVYKGQTHTFVLPAIDLQTIESKVGFAISNEETRYYLNGIFMHTTDAGLTAVATDGHRLSKITLDQPEGAARMPGIIVPERTTKLFKLLSGKDDAPVTVELSDSFIRLSNANLSITSKLIDGTFPDYSRVIPIGNDKIATADLASLRGAVERLAIHATNKDRTVQWFFTPGLLEMRSRSELGEAEDHIEIECDFEMAIGFNARYVAKMLEGFRGPKVRIQLDNPSSPTLMLDLGDDRRELVIMPQRI